MSIIGIVYFLVASKSTWNAETNWGQWNLWSLV